MRDSWSVQNVGKGTRRLKRHERTLDLCVQFRGFVWRLFTHEKREVADQMASIWTGTRWESGRKDVHKVTHLCDRWEKHVRKTAMLNVLPMRNATAMRKSRRGH